MSEVGIEPSYVGKNEKLKFIVPQELFRMKLQSSDSKKVDPEISKLYNKYIQETFIGFQEARKTKYGNENNTETKTTPAFWKEFEKESKKLGIDLIGYTPLKEDFIFYKLKVFGRNLIILGMEMLWDEIKTAPSINCSIEAFRVYSELGKVAIQLTEYLKERGYKCETHHPFGGKFLFPPHAVAAGLGIMGRNGLVITPEFGPRQRWAIISTDAELPAPVKSNLTAMEEYCKDCGACIRGCKGGAAYETPIYHEESPVITHIDRSKCIDSLINNNYCSYCLKVCPQGHPQKKPI